MFSSSKKPRVFIFNHGVDGRKSHNGLAAIVRNEMGYDMSKGDIFLFISKNRRVGKAVIFDGTGLLLFYKKLELGRFMSPDDLKESQQISVSQLWKIFSGCQLILGIDLS